MESYTIKITNFFIQRYWWGGIVSGTLLGIGLLHPLTAVLAGAGVAGSIWLAHQLPSTRALGIAGALSWMTKALIVMSYLWLMYPIYWLPTIPGGAQLAVIGLNWIVAGIALGVVGALVWVGIHTLNTKSLPLMVLAIALGLVWLLGEVLGSLLFSIVFLGPGSTVGLAFTFGFIGYALAAVPVLQFAALAFGVYGLSFVLVVLSFLCLSLLSTKHRVSALISMVAVVVVCVYGVSSVDYQAQGITVASIDTTLRDRTSTPEKNAEAMAAMHEAMAAGLSINPDYILLPEDARYFSRLGQVAPSPANNFVKFQLSTSEAVIIDSSRTVLSPTEVVLRASYHLAGEVLATVDKQLLTPQGEYLSYWQSGLLRVLGFGAVLESYFRSSYVAGADHEIDNVSLPGVLFCFEASHPFVLEQRVSKHTPFVAYPISHAWFYDAHILTHQVDMMVRTHSIANQIAIVSAANLETGKVYYPDGQIVVPSVIDGGEQWQLRVIEL